ncbi:MAG: hypothetical protein ACO1SX_25785 [Actinomycetota bacterium]
MRFKVDDGALASITRDYSKLSPKETGELVDYLTDDAGVAYPPNARPNVGAEHHVYWERLKRIAHPVAYAKTGADGGSPSRLVTDAPRRLVYYYHWNQ